MNEISDEIAGSLDESAALQSEMARHPDDIAASIQRIVQALRDGGTLYVMGNGGSAADAQHLAGELIGRFEVERPALPCVALTTDTSVLTAIANDYGVEDVFSRQVEALVGSEDVVMGISTSGNSGNVVRALNAARRRGAATIGMTGASGGKMSHICDVNIRVPAERTAPIQEAHGTIIHIMCRILERELSDRAEPDR